ncbi:MAG: outer membrane lipoprotein carrier protein LolA [Candidatus Omnitrophica bacterium]|nr:outer membrane lipoprotein carrier protein LolA [Candidatus Omnitrophota bacterium]
MKRNWLQVAACVFLIGQAGALQAQELPGDKASLPKEAQELAAKASALKSYRAKFTLQAQEEGGEKVELEGTLLFERPNHRRLEIRSAGAQEMTQMLVSEGNVEWQYYPSAKVVYRMNNPPEAPGPHRPFSEAQAQSLKFTGRSGAGGEAVARFEGIPEPVFVQGSPVPISSMRLEVGESDGLMRKLVLLNQQGKEVLAQQYREVEVDVEPWKGAFTFTPPEGVEVVEVGKEG